MAMTKRKTKLEDGRYLIYFEFDKKVEPSDASGQKASRSTDSIDKRKGGGK